MSGVTARAAVVQSVKKHDMRVADAVIIDDAVSAFSLCVYILRENEYNNMIGKNIFDGGRCFGH